MTKERNPLEWLEGRWDSLDGLRWLGCPDYNTCLLEAAKLLWAGFSCKECPRWDGKQTPLESDPYLSNVDWSRLEEVLLRGGKGGKRGEGD